MHKCNVGFDKKSYFPFFRINIVYLQGVPNISDVEEEQGEFASKAIRGLKMRTLSKMKTVVIVISPVSLPMQV